MTDMRRDVFVYISGPMTPKHGFTAEQNVAEGVKTYIEVLKLGFPAFCPHLSGLFPSAWTDIRWETWIDYDLAVIERCTHVLMMPRWIESVGAVKEREFAIERKKPIAFSTPELIAMIGTKA
jgi:hypothetical protein